MQNTKEAAIFAISLIGAVAEAKKDGFSTNDLALLVDPMMKAMPAFEDISKVKQEIEEMDDEQRAEFNAYIQQEFDLENDKVELIVEKAIEVALAVAALYNATQAE